MGNAATANTGDGGRPAAAKAAADLPAFTIELDKSRTHSEVHGEYAFNLGFIQDGLPFDKGARLVKELFGKPGFENARAIHDRKIRALESAFVDAARVDDEDTGNKVGP